MIGDAVRAACRHWLQAAARCETPRAYGHAARYWARLKEIAGSGGSLLPMPSHDALEAEIRVRHRRKTAFWAHVNGTRCDRRDEADDLDL